MTAADLAYGDGRWDKAAELYLSDASFSSEEGWRAFDGAVRSMLADGQIEAAESQLARMQAADKTNPWTTLALSRVEWRKGHIDEGIRAGLVAFHAAPCNALARQHMGHMESFSGNHASARSNYTVAHSLAPLDPGVWRTWVSTLPRAQRLEELEKFLGQSHDFNQEDQLRYESWRAALKKAPARNCRLVSATDHTSLPLKHVGEGRAYDPWGLDIQIEGKRRRLEVDTGASGIVLSREAASALHLDSYAHGMTGGAGDEGLAKYSSAVMKSLKIGDLEFADCTVDIISDTNKGLRGTDGLIGGDVFSDFLVTLDYPGHKIDLAALPPLPGAANAKGTISLDTSGDDDNRPTRDRYVDPSMKNWVRNFTSGSHIFIPVRVGDGPVRLFLVDTGAGVSNISRRTAMEAGKIYNGSMLDIVGISGEVKKTFTTAPVKLTFAGLQVPPEPFVGFDVKMLNEHTGVEIGGILGAPVLNLLTVKIDYRDDLITFVYDPKRILPNF